MAKKFSSKRCVHCLQHFELLTSDHVLPLSWYPDTTPSDIEKWQIPACTECNRKYGQLENDLLLRFGLCLEPKALKTLGIPEKALRSISPEYARNKRDREHRQKRKEKVLRELQSPTEFPKESLMPEFGPYWEVEIDQQKIILVPVTELKLFGEKLVRGTAYVLESRYIEADHKIEIFLSGEINPQPFIDLLSRFGKEDTCGPGIKARIAFVPSDPQSGVFEFTIWGRLRIFATVESIILSRFKKIKNCLTGVLQRTRAARA